MSGHKYMSDTRNLFEENNADEDKSVESYRSRIPPSQPKPSPSPYITDLEKQRQMMLEKQKVIEQRTLDSSIRSKASLRESYDIGVATAEESIRQREQLQNTSSRLDDINSNLTYSQKNLNGIRSFFYGFKNYFSGKTNQTAPKDQVSPYLSSSKVATSCRLDDAIDYMDPSDRFESHPTTHLRGFDGQATSEPVSDTQNINTMLNANLDEMSTDISRLKGLGIALGEEIEQQNNLIDEIHKKVDDTDVKIGHQNKQINKLIGN